jgi:hypothetical protein
VDPVGERSPCLGGVLGRPSRRMDVLERARALAACPLFEGLAPAVVIRLAERASAIELARGERRTSEDMVWVVAAGQFAVAVYAPSGDIATASLVRARGASAAAGQAVGMVRVIRRATPAVEIVALEPSVLVGLAAEDVRDVLDEDASALGALADRLAASLLDEAV